MFKIHRENDGVQEIEVRICRLVDNLYSARIKDGLDVMRPAQEKMDEYFDSQE